jgi:ferredoxin-NADP reductase
MYRLTIYCLVFILVIALFLGFFRVLPYAPLDILLTTVYLIATGYIFNEIFAFVLKVPTNRESVYITALILTFLVAPTPVFSNLLFLTMLTLAAIAIKYLAVVKGKHFFNPAAMAVLLIAFLGGASANWWVATPILSLAMMIVGILIGRKLRRVDLIASFFAAFIATIMIFNIGQNVNSANFITSSFLYYPVLFFGFIMLTEPITTPGRKKERIYYGLLTGFLVAPVFHIGSLYLTPELALIIGNIFSYVLSFKERLILKLKEKKVIANNIYEFSFEQAQPLNFVPGQYMEWTLPHENSDNRGIRRFFTIASAPGDEFLKLGIKFYDKPSTYKKTLLALEPGGEILAGQLAGDFVLPRDKAEKLVFMAGGIGITPFISILKDLMNKKEKRSIIMFYSCNCVEDIAYQDVLKAAIEKLDVKIIYFLADLTNIPAGWSGGNISKDVIKTDAPDYLKRTFYVSGPPMMVSAYEKILKELKVSEHHIKTDYFPGFA